MTDDEILELAKQDKPISRKELGIVTPLTEDGLQILDESICKFPILDKLFNIFKI